MMVPIHALQWYRIADTVTLLYVIDPIDMVPDFIVGGFLDDVTVIGWAITKVAQELEDYKLYRPSNFDYLE